MEIVQCIEEYFTITVASLVIFVFFVFLLCAFIVMFLCFSACSGLVSAILGTPADVVKTRVMNQQYVNGR